MNEGLQPKTTGPLSAGEMKAESIAAVRRGDAVPTPAFVAERDNEARDEMQAALVREMQGLDDSQLDDFMLNLSNVKLALGIETGRAQELGRTAWTTDTNAFRLALGYVVGESLFPMIGGGLGATMSLAYDKVIARYAKAGRSLEDIYVRLKTVEEIVEAVRDQKKLNREKAA